MKKRTKLKLKQAQMKINIYKLLIGIMVEGGTKLSSPILLDLNRELEKYVFKTIKLGKQLRFLERKSDLYTTIFK